MGGEALILALLSKGAQISTCLSSLVRLLQDMLFIVSEMFGLASASKGFPHFDLHVLLYQFCIRGDEGGLHPCLRKLAIE